MNVDIDFLGIMISLGVNFFLLYTRKLLWNTDLLRWLIVGLLFSIGLFGLYGRINHMDIDFFFWCLMTPLIYNVFDRLFKKLSEINVGRDFQLWLRHSIEIDDSIGARNDLVNRTDIIFSMLLLIIIFTLPFFGM